MQLNLQGLTEEELVNLRTQINDRISAMRKMDHEEETSLFRSRYEGKYFYTLMEQYIIFLKLLINMLR